MSSKRIRAAVILTALLSSTIALADDCGTLIGKVFLAEEGTPPLNFSEKRTDGIYFNQVISPGQKFQVTALEPVHGGVDTVNVLTKDGRELSITCAQLESALGPTFPFQRVRPAKPEDFSQAQVAFDAKQNAANAEAADKAAQLEAEWKAKAQAAEAELQRKRDTEAKARQEALAREAARKKQERDAAVKYREERIARGGVRIGMTETQALVSSWGEPDKRNHTITPQSDAEQWVYAGGQYLLYFVNGVLTGIQTDAPDTGYFRVAH